MSFSSLARPAKAELHGRAAIASVAAMIGVLFAGSTLLTPLYVIYQQHFGFSRIVLTLIYAAYVVGNLLALLFFGRLSDEIGRRPIALIAMAIAIVSALTFLFAGDMAALYLGRILSGLGVGIGAGTGTAWLAELTEAEDKSSAATIATSTNFVGLALGPLVAGTLADHASAPLSLPFVVYLMAVLAAALFVWFTPETVSRRRAQGNSSFLRPRLSVPRNIRVRFVAPAVTGFGAMALVGFFAAVSPSVLAEELHETSHMAAGALFFELASIAAAAIVVTRHVPSRTSMLSALVLMIPGVGLIALAQIEVSLALMIIATALIGAAAALGYRGSLQVVNEIAPGDRRAEVVSSFFVACFTGNALPVIGIGVLSTLAGAIAASLTFGVMITFFALFALYFGANYTR
jgi:MFS family permease